MPDLLGLTGEDAARKLREMGMTALVSGEGQTVTGQLPAAGERIPKGGSVLLYLDEQEN